MLYELINSKKHKIVKKKLKLFRFIIKDENEKLIIFIIKSLSKNIKKVINTI
jgi:hypothetical protein